MDIKVKSLQQGSAPPEAFGSYSASISTRSTFGDSLQKIGKNLDNLKKKREEESDTLTADRLISDWSAQKTLADQLMRSTDIDEVRRGKELSDSLNPDTYDFNGYAKSIGISPLYDEENFTRYKNSAREHWTVQQGLYAISEADRSRAVGIKNQTNTYNQEFNDQLDFESGYDIDFLKSKVDYFGTEQYQNLEKSGGEELKETIAFGHTKPLLEALKHNFNTAKLPQDYDDAMEALEYARDNIPAEMFNKELVSALTQSVTNARVRVNDPNSMTGQFKTASSTLTNYVNSIPDINTVSGKSAYAQASIAAIDQLRKDYSILIEEGSTVDLRLKSERGYSSLYSIDEDGDSPFYSAVLAELLNEDPRYDALLADLQSSHKSKFRDDVSSFASAFQTMAEEGNPNALAMIDSTYAKDLESWKSGNITTAQLRTSYNSAREIAVSIPGLSIPEFYVKNRDIEEFPEPNDITGRRSYIEEVIGNNDLKGIEIASKRAEDADEQIMLRYAHFQLASGESLDAAKDTAEWWATALSDPDHEYSSQITQIVNDLLEDPNVEDSEMFNLYRVHRQSNKLEMADAYLKGFKSLLNEAYVANPGKNNKQILKYARSLEKSKLTSQGVFRSLNGRDTFIPRDLYNHIDPNIDANFAFIAGPQQLSSGRLSVDNGLRSVEAAVFVEVADQMAEYLPNSIEQTILKSPELIEEFMPDLYDTMTEDEINELTELQNRYAQTGVMSMGPQMPGYNALRNYLTEDKRKEIARGLYFNTYKIGGKDIPIAALDYTTNKEGQRGYHVRLLDVDTGKHTKYLESEDKVKFFISIDSIKGSVKHAKQRHIYQGVSRTSTSRDEPFTMKMLESFMDTPSGLLMKDNRFIDAILEYKDIK